MLEDARATAPRECTDRRVATHDRIVHARSFGMRLPRLFQLQDLFEHRSLRWLAGGAFGEAELPLHERESNRLLCHREEEVQLTHESVEEVRGHLATATAQEHLSKELTLVLLDLGFAVHTG